MGLNLNNLIDDNAKHRIASAIDRERILNILKKNFQADLIEKYEQSVIDAMIREATNKFTGNGKVSQRALSRMQKYMIGKVRKKYKSSYLNILKIKDSFCFNISCIYKTPLGRLYSSGMNEGIFVTAHALERFENRLEIMISDDSYDELFGFFKDKYGTDPTPLDLMDFMIYSSDRYAITDRCIMLAVMFGGLVAIPTEGIYIIKTFLSPEMIDKNLKWYYHESVNMIDLNNPGELAPSPKIGEVLI